MAELLKRIIQSQIPNVFIQDLNIKLRNVGDSIDLLKPIISGTNSKKSRRTLEQIGASHDLDTALARGWIILFDQNGEQLTDMEALKATNLSTLRDGGTSDSASTATSGSIEIAQASHGLSLGEVLRFNGTSYVRAQADSDTNAEVVGIVSQITDADNFTLVTSGYIDIFSGLVAGNVYFLSESVAGALTLTEPVIDGTVSKPLLITNGTTSGFLFNFRGVENETETPVVIPNNLALIYLGL